MTGLRWSRRTTARIADALSERGLSVCPNTVARLLHQMDYSLRVNRKLLATDASPNREQQFDYLAELRNRFQHRHQPIISVDTKKRELVGNFYNPGRRWARTPCQVFDHDFRSDAIGIAIPYGIYDVAKNRGTLVVGVSHDTPAFAAHAITHWWRQEGEVPQKYRHRSEDCCLIIPVTETREATWVPRACASMLYPFVQATNWPHAERRGGCWTSSVESPGAIAKWPSGYCGTRSSGHAAARAGHVGM